MLRDLQQIFSNYMLSRDNSITEKIRSIFPKSRMDVYRETIHENLRYALELTYPSIVKLVGYECFNNLTYAFLGNIIYWPKTACLDDWGEDFYLFLNSFREIKDISYLGDIAQLDWLMHKSNITLESTTLDPKIFESCFHKNSENFRVLFKPSVFLFKSAYFLPDVIDLLISQNTQKICLKNNPCYAIIFKRKNQVKLEWLNTYQFEFLALLKEKSLTESICQITEKNNDFDIVSALEFIFCLEIMAAETVTSLPK